MESTGSSVHRMLSLATSLPSSSASSIALALQALANGGEGLKWVCGTAGSVVSFANRNVVLPALRKVASPLISGRDPVPESADPNALHFSTQQTGRRSALHRIARRPAARTTFSHPAAQEQRLSLREASAWGSHYSLGHASFDEAEYTMEEDDAVEQVHEGLNLMHLGMSLQSSLL